MSTLFQLPATLQPDELFHLNPESAILGRSHFEPQWFFRRVPPGEYTVKLTVDDQVLIPKVQVLEDYWFDK